MAERYVYVDYNKKNLDPHDAQMLCDAIGRNKSVIFINGEHSEGTIFEFDPGSESSEKLGKLLNTPGPQNITTSRERSKYLLDQMKLSLRK